jgi:hypothetical protein
MLIFLPARCAVVKLRRQVRLHARPFCNDRIKANPSSCGIHPDKGGISRPSRPVCLAAGTMSASYRGQLPHNVERLAFMATGSARSWRQ